MQCSMGNSDSLCLLKDDMTDTSDRLISSLAYQILETDLLVLAYAVCYHACFVAWKKHYALFANKPSSSAYSLRLQFANPLL